MESQLPVLKTTPSLLPKGGWKQGSCGICQFCGSTFISSTNRGQRYCSRSCSRKAFWVNKTPAERQVIAAKSAVKLLGKTPWNKGAPCATETKAKLSAAHKASGHKPRVLGGNGRIAPCERMMGEILSTQWVYQYAIPTKKPRGTGYPTSYKLDFALPDKRWGLEIDGNSHRSRKDLDAKKDSLLESLGWSVLRVTNQQVLAWYTTYKSTGHIPIQLRDD